MGYSANKKPNVIWVFGDQHRAQALGCNGDPNLHTPNIDNLAVSGVNFTQAVSGFPLCCPYRGSLLTGIYPHKCVPGHQYRLPSGRPTIAHVFNDHGYETAYFGKWHLDGFQESQGRAAYHIVPPERRGGFRHWIGYENNNSQMDCWVHGGEGEQAFHYRLPGYETDELTNLLIGYIRERGKDESPDRDRPFFAVLSVQPPHDPYTAPESAMGRHTPAKVQFRANVPDIPVVRQQAGRELAGYYAMIENLDWNVGRIRQALADSGLSFDTHLLFFSDHGDMHGSHGQFRKTTPYEESIRVPFIISGGQPRYEQWKTGNVKAPINHVDIAPTTLGLCGIEKPDWMEGTDYSSYRLSSRPKENEPESAYLQCVVPTGHLDSVNKPWRGVVTRDGWKYVCLEGMPWLMFNLNDDPYEQMNLAFNNRYAAERKRLNDLLKDWAGKTDDSFPVPEVE